MLECCEVRVEMFDLLPAHAYRLQTPRLGNSPATIHQRRASNLNHLDHHSDAISDRRQRIYLERSAARLPMRSFNPVHPQTPSPLSLIEQHSALWIGPDTHIPPDYDAYPRSQNHSGTQENRRQSSLNPKINHTSLSSIIPPTKPSAK